MENYNVLIIRGRIYLEPRFINLAQEKILPFMQPSRLLIELEYALFRLEYAKCRRLKVMN